jgi:HSP20 family protein
LLPSFFNSRQIKVDIKETENEYIIEAELPGVKKEEISLEINDDLLTISVERNEETTTEKENYIRKERSFGSMSRSFAISNIINEKVSANFSDGILTVILPKKKTGMPKNRRIDID